MNHNTSTGRIMGAAMLAGALFEAWSNFALQGRIFAGGGFLANAAGQPETIGLIIVSEESGCLSFFDAGKSLLRIGRPPEKGKGC